MSPFKKNGGTPEHVLFETLTAWNESSDNGIKYFSGTATYSKTMNINPSWLTTNNELYLDLGEVQNLAEVIVNGRSLGVVWKSPFRLLLGNVIKEGENQLEIKVVNLWVNRLIGDQQPGIVNKLTYTTQAFYRTKSPLKRSGLLGPVYIVTLK